MSATPRTDEEAARRLKQEIQAVARKSPKSRLQPSSEKAPPKVWIIYGHGEQDELVARGLVERLRGDGISVGWDKDLLPGEEFDVLIERSIRECDSAVVIWSEKAKASRYVRDEATLALELDKLVTVHAEGFNTATLSMRFKRLQATDVADYEKLRRKLQGTA